MEYFYQFYYLMTQWEYAKGFIFGIIIFPFLPSLVHALVDFAVLIIKFIVGFFEDLKK